MAWTSSSSAENAELDWSKFRNTRKSMTFEELASYSRASVDPFTVEVARFVCEQFSLASKGQRNLAQAYNNLPLPNFDIVGIGYDRGHIVNTIITDEPGYVFLGICGVLAEYFSEDFLVEVFVSLTESAQISNDLTPSRLQWKRLVHVCFGVLFTTEFGILVDKLTTAGQKASDEYFGIAGLEHATPQFIAHAVKAMNSLKTQKEQQLELNGGLDAGWLAAVAEWLFDLNVAIHDQAGTQLHSRSKNGDTGELQLIVNCRNSGPPFNATLGERDFHPITKTVTGGRVVWDTLFRSCFGQTFHDIDVDRLAKVVGCAAKITTESISYKHLDPKTYFLPQTGTSQGKNGHGLIQTITAWFPELQRLTSRMQRWTSLTVDETWTEYIAQLNALESVCGCADCRSARASSNPEHASNPTPAASTTFCQATVVEIIVLLGLFISRVIVTPELYPKRSGILAFYDRKHTERQADKTKTSADPETAEERLIYLGSLLPTPRGIIEATFLLFTGSVPANLAGNCAAHTAAGIGAFYTDFRMLKGPPLTMVGVKVTTGTLAFYGRIFERTLYDKGVSGMEHQEAQEYVRTNPYGCKSIGLEHGDDILLNVIRIGHGEEERAVKMGWTVL